MGLQSARFGIGLVMDIARTSMIHAHAPHFLWPNTVWYAAHHLNLWLLVSQLGASPTSLWTGTPLTSPFTTLPFTGSLTLAKSVSTSQSPTTLVTPVEVSRSLPPPSLSGSRSPSCPFGPTSGGAGVGGTFPGGAIPGGAGAPSSGPGETGTGRVATGGAHSGGGATDAVGAREAGVGAAAAGASAAGGVAAAGVAVAAAAATAPDPCHWPPSPWSSLSSSCLLLLSSCVRPPPPSPSAIPSPPESSLTASSSTPVTDYYRTYRPVLSYVLSSLVMDPHASLSSVSALTAAVPDFAATRRLDYATRVVAAPPTRPLSDGEMATYRSTGTYIDEVPPPGANVVDGMWIFNVKRPRGSPPVFKARYVARGFSQRDGVDFFQTFAPTPTMTTLWVFLHVAAQRDYELHSLKNSTAFLQGSLHEEVWLSRPSSFTGTFPPETQWRLRRLVYGLRQAPCEWHNTLRSMLSDLGFEPSSADLSLFVRHGPTHFFVLVYVNAMVIRVALVEVKSKLQKRHTCIDLGELRHYLGQ
ncbi:unnamed protein product [Closterium sp. NIES-53]